MSHVGREQRQSVRALDRLADRQRVRVGGESRNDQKRGLRVSGCTGLRRSIAGAGGLADQAYNSAGSVTDELSVEEPGNMS